MNIKYVWLILLLSLLFYISAPALSALPLMSALSSEEVSMPIVFSLIAIALLYAVFSENKKINKLHKEKMILMDEMDKSLSEFKQKQKMAKSNPKNKLAYSPLSDQVYYFNAKGEKQDVHQSFIQGMLLWMNQGEDPPVGTTEQRELTNNGKVHWRITCERVSE